MVEAIGLIDARLGELEDRLRALAEVTGTIVRSIDATRGEGGESPSDD